MEFVKASYPGYHMVLGCCLHMAMGFGNLHAWTIWERTEFYNHHQDSHCYYYGIVFHNSGQSRTGLKVMGGVTSIVNTGVNKIGLTPVCWRFGIQENLNTTDVSCWDPKVW